MAEPRFAPYGTWRSPIGAHDVAVHAWRPGWTDFVGDELWWTMPTPAEGGRVRLFRESAGDGSPVLPEPWSVRTGFVEYGGKPFAGYVGAEGPAVVFTEWSDQRLYLLEPDSKPASENAAPRPLTPRPSFPSAVRYVDPLIVAELGEVWCVREEFHSPEPTDVTRAIVAVPLDGSGGVRTLMGGADGTAAQHFLMNPRRSPDGGKLAWIGWDHPDMPWDSATLWVAELDGSGDAARRRARRIAGGDGVAVAQAEWLDADTLVYSSDENGWWNLYTARSDGTDARLAVAGEEEFGGAAWQPGQRWFAVLPGGRRVAAIHGHTVKSVSVYDLFDTGNVRAVDSPHTSWISAIAACGDRVATQAGGPGTPYEIVTFEAKADAVAAVEVVSAGADPFGAAWVPESSTVTLRATDGREIHANLYAPANPEYAGGAEGEKPPYVVFVHGGPTGSASLVYDLEVGYFTSRGIGVVDVNYAGSTGYGRAYRERLRGQWGVADVEDCAAVVAALVEQGIADGARIAIRGGSAGGWTSAAALAADPAGRTYRCGAIRFPVLDPVAWRTGGTHDLESRYLDGLIGPWPQAAARYREVSPLEGAGRIAVPFVLLQGMQDAVCPPAQTRVFLDRVEGGKVPFGYLAFEGEQHGFRRASTIAAALEAELSLYGQAMGFDPPGVQRLELGS
jgi:dipeptidyl aminopeptidase/acylaminoacyl peptidase